MKTLCSKSGKGGKIHPSPPADDFEQTAAALRLLPAAILVLAAVLRPEDQQVVAYLVTRSFQGAATPEPQVVRGGRRRPHSPAIGCGCFDCYTSFWSRWDCSPDRDDIHRVIDAFEAHLADAESASSTPSSKRRDKGKRKPPPSPPPPPRQLMFPEKPGSQSGRAQEPSPAPASPPRTPPRQLMCPEKQPGMAQEPSPAPASPPLPPVPVASQDEEKVPEDSSMVEADAAAVEKSDAGKEEEERKRGWADVVGMLNLRLWGIWSPAVESAT